MFTYQSLKKPQASINLTVALHICDFPALNAVFCLFFFTDLVTNPWGSSVNKNLIIIEKTVFFLLKNLNNVPHLFFLVSLPMLFVTEHLERAATEATAARRQQKEKF